VGCQKHVEYQQLQLTVVISSVQQQQLQGQGLVLTSANVILGSCPVQLM
jgi:hypothetical protein